MSKRRLLAGLIGSGIQKSLSPALHEAEGDAQGLRIMYQRLDLDVLHCTPDDLPELLRAAELAGFAGLNITHPCKQRVIAHLDALSPVAEALGAVNTVVLRDGQRVGHNTDAWGWSQGFQKGLPDADLGHAVQLGAGGAGAAVAYAALELGVQRLTLIDLDPARAEALAARLAAQFPDRQVEASQDLASAVSQASGVIHATPTGMLAHPGLPFDPELLRPGMWLSEVVYVPLETELLRAARARGCHTVHGGYMAVFQAARAFELFSGLVPDLGRMLAHFEALIQSNEAVR
ncbi:Shikimate dehydrogenase (plasmid) [Deinococcus geothermalis DSM 11300]|uniref:Shikimate dehydrogenase n=1 Tax=Deinococcus geothermalis (strain DSM 11300 / CIP 105573 / AG-3a) TaxID=319795 RepID=Q1J3W9_DEIGD|nr:MULTISPECIES: shikimate dehydrogenase [Deinococcus]ABF43809.1 Shikimate dehydrogenase [Deinococcus geothermalis DSM 11300]MBI0446525.1 shikimate dehydrogenase [Deinococcus sp. DB0503]TDE85249.1 shikimate dehydrogenase [Deinococcus sp. S9]